MLCRKINLFIVKNLMSLFLYNFSYILLTFKSEQSEKYTNYLPIVIIISLSF